MIHRAIIGTLGEKGPMTAGTLAREIKATYRTVSGHLYILVQFRRKVEVISFYPDIRLYGLKKKRHIARCQKCGEKIVIAG